MADILTASLATSPVEVEVASSVWTIPALPASAWIGAVHSNNCPWSVVPGLLCREDYADAIDTLANAEIDDMEARTAGFAAIRKAAGRPWWEAIRLVAACNDDMGSVMGRMALSGMDPDSVPFGRWCAAVYACLTDGADSKELMKFNSKLQMPPNVPEAFDTSEEEDFNAMVQMARNMPGMSTG